MAWWLHFRLQWTLNVNFGGAAGMLGVELLIYTCILGSLDELGGVCHTTMLEAALLLSLMLRVLNWRSVGDYSEGDLCAKSIKKQHENGGRRKTFLRKELVFVSHWLVSLHFLVESRADGSGDYQDDEWRDHICSFLCPPCTAGSLWHMEIIRTGIYLSTFRGDKESLKYTCIPGGLIFYDLHFHNSHLASNLAKKTSGKVEILAQNEK